MPKKILATLLLLFSFFSSQTATICMAIDSPPLTTINGQVLSENDFLVWWKHWQEADSVLSEALDPFVDWSLEAQEAERMELYDEGSFKHKIEVFLKARTLGLLRYDEVESKIAISDADLEKIYKERYTPLWNVRILQLPSMDDALFLRTSLLSNGDGALTSSKIDTVLLNSKILAHDSEKNFRPDNLPVVFKEALSRLQPGEISIPIQIKNVFLLVFLAEINNGDVADYQEVKTKIKKEYRRELQDLYTNQLIIRLKAKYHVSVDEELLNALDPLNPRKEDFDKVLIKTDVQSATVAFFLKHFNNNIKFRKKATFGKSGITRMKYSIVQTIISHNLTTWESLARHYERKSPFKETYEFYRQNRLIAELHNRLLPSSFSVPDEEIQQFYENHAADFNVDSRAVVIVIENEMAIIKKIWMETLTGGDFDSIIKKYGLTDELHEITISSKSDKELWKSTNGLDIGGISSPIKNGSHGRIVRLIRRIDPRTVPISKVRASIAKKLTEEKRQKVYEDFLDKLKGHSEISINKDVWQEILVKKNKPHDA